MILRAALLAVLAAGVPDVAPRAEKFHPAAPRLSRVLAGHKGNVQAVAFSRDGKSLVAVGSDSGGQLWDTRTLAVVRAFPKTFMPTDGAQLSADGSRVVGLGVDRRSLRVLDAKSGVELVSIPNAMVNYGSFAVSPDGQKVLLALNDRSIRIYSLANGEELAQLQAPGHPVSGAVAWSADGKTAVSAGWDGSLRVIDVASRTDRWTLEARAERYCMPLSSPDSKVLALVGVSDRKIRLYDFESGRELPSPAGTASNARAADFVPGTSLLAYADAAGIVRFWDRLDGKEKYSFRAGPGVQLMVRSSPDGRWFVTSGVDGALRVWGATGKAPDAKAERPGAPGFLGIKASLEEEEGLVGVRIQEVIPGGGAEKAGIKDGDVVLKIAGKDTPDFETLRGVVSSLREGDEIEVVYKRDGVEAKVKARLGARPPE